MKRIPVECYEILSKKLNYNPITGVFTWIKAPNKTMKDGQVAGCIQGWGYRQFTCRIGDRTYQPRAHILAWYMYHGVIPKGFIDHVDRCKDNNAIDNLRDVDRCLNGMNRSEYKNKKNKTGYTGVYFNGKTYTASITNKGSLVNLGKFDNKSDAVQARLDAEIKYYGMNFNNSPTKSQVTK